MALTTAMWVSAYLARLEAAGIYAHLVARGATGAGDVAVKLSLMDGRAALWARAMDAAGRPAFVEDLAPAPEAEVDAVLARRRARDRDLWIVEVEDRHGRHLLDQPGVGDAFRADGAGGWPD
ncbi:MAG: DUF1491 family protein [Pseudomonadota bacterium]